MPPPVNDALVQRMRECGYELLELLGRGGMGRVWRAHERKLARDVAIKFVPDARGNPLTRQRFLAEARALARVQHPNVVAVYTFGEVGEQPYLAYELVEGVGLDTMVGGLTWPRALAILIDLARGLRAVHEAGLLHRDLKPANAMLTASGQAKLIDFGLAKILGGEPVPVVRSPSGEAHRQAELDTKIASLIDRDPTSGENSTDWSSDHTVSMVVDVSAGASVGAPEVGDYAGASSTTRAGAILGTPRYLAPELWMGESASAQTDLYSLGLIAWELLTGRSAHSGQHGSALVMAIVDMPLEPVAELAPGVPASFAAIIDRAVAKDPLGRQTSAAQLCDELELIADNLHALRLLPEPSHAREHEDHESDEQRRIALVRASLTRVLADGQFGARFYARLFERHPELRPLFPGTLREQAIKLADALRLAVSLLRDPPTLEATLTELGARHVLYGVEEDQLDHVRDALVELLGETEAERMTDELLAAWVWTWGRLDHAFRTGMRQALRQARERTPTPMPPTRWVRCGSTSVAYRTLDLGAPAGSFDLVIIPSWFAHGELAWRSPEYVQWLARLAEHARVTVFDRRGTGLSDRPSQPLSLTSALAEIATVLDEIEARDVVLLGLQEGGVLAQRFASRHPERVRAWIGWGTGPRGLPAARVEPLCAAIERGWGEPLFAELVAPSHAHEPEFRRVWSDLLRNGASPTSAQTMLRFAATLEFQRAPGSTLATAIGTVGKPGLLIHRTGDRWMPVAGARAAAELGDARLVELPGDDHLPWIGDAAGGVATITEFLTRLRC